MDERMLADVLWDAANVHLASNPNHETNKTDRFSCFAVTLAACGAITQVKECLLHSIPEDAATALRFLYSLGLDYGAQDDEWGSFKGEVLQGVRYMWLLLAMHVAEDEGIEL